MYVCLCMSIYECRYIFGGVHDVCFHEHVCVIDRPSVTTLGLTRTSVWTTLVSLFTPTGQVTAGTSRPPRTRPSDQTCWYCGPGILPVLVFSLVVLNNGEIMLEHAPLFSASNANVHTHSRLQVCFNPCIHVQSQMCTHTYTHTHTHTHRHTRTHTHTHTHTHKIHTKT